MGTIEIDGREFPAEPDKNLLQVSLTHGFDLPYFCWHPALNSVGACRQCAVKQYSGPDDKTGRIVMACMTPAAEGTRISIADPEAAAFRGNVIEWLMTNHPHDCPVCEEGGECHLQDMTVMSGHNYRRYRFTKRTHRNQDLGPFIKHEMNRCIACYRCVRFYRDYADGTDLDVFASHNNVYFGRAEDGVLDNPFSGNLVEICPTGVFTDKTLSAAYNRKWDLRSAPSVCVHCAVGCNIGVSERGGQVKRILNRYNGDVNGYFICDRGRFGYGFTNREDRIRAPLLRDADGTTRPVEAEAAVAMVQAWRAEGGRTIGIGSPRASLEANFALRELVGAAAFHPGVTAPEAACLRAILGRLRHGTVPTPNIREVEAADAILVLGEDVSATAPRVALALRQAVRGRAAALAATAKIATWQDAAVRELAQGERHPMFVLSPGETALDGICAGVGHAAPDDILRVALAIRHRLAGGATVALPPALEALAGRIVAALEGAARPLIVAGCELGSPALVEAASAIAEALAAPSRTPRLLYAVPSCNSLGLAMMHEGDIGGALRDSTGAVVIVLEADLYRLAGKESVDAMIDSVARLVVLDHVATPTAAKADLVLPAANFAEAEGTLVSAEGRAQRGFPVVDPGAAVQPAWHWLGQLGGTAARATPDDVRAALIAALPVFAGIAAAAPPDDFRIVGSRIASEPARFSGRTAIDAHRTIHEPAAQRPARSPLSTTMEGYYGPMPPALLPFTWAPGWNSVQSLNKFQEEVGGALRGGNPGVRLIEPAGDEAAPAPAAPPAFRAEAGSWLVVPRHLVFGGEELSDLAPAIAERRQPAALELGAADAESLGLADGGMVELGHAGMSVRIGVRVSSALPPGVAALDVRGLPGFASPVRCTLRAVVVEPVS